MTVANKDLRQERLQLRLIANESDMGEARPTLTTTSSVDRLLVCCRASLAPEDCALRRVRDKTERRLVNVDAERRLPCGNGALGEVPPLPDGNSLEGGFRN